MRVERGDKDQHSTNPVSLASFSVLSDLGLQPESPTVDALLHTILLVERHHHTLKLTIEALVHLSTNNYSNSKNHLQYLL